MNLVSGCFRCISEAHDNSLSLSETFFFINDYPFNESFDLLLIYLFIYLLLILVDKTTMKRSMLLKV